MERVGGYHGYLDLLEDGRAYEDVVIVLQAEAEAQKIRELEDRLKAGRG